MPATTGRANLPPARPPFRVTKIGQFSDPFAMAFLPDGSLLVTEKAGKLKLRLAGPPSPVFPTGNVPKVIMGDQGGLLGVAVAPDYATTHHIYLTYSAGSDDAHTELVLARARFFSAGDRADPRLDTVEVLWRSGSIGPGGQFGAKIAFAPDGKSLFLTSGERQRFSPAQDPNQALGKILRLTLDGKPWPGNPHYNAGGVRAMTWSTGHRNPYGLVFTPDGRLWEEEMGPRGGDELNLILPGRNYGWPIVSNGDNYSGVPIPDHPSRPDLEAPKLWWNPSISPGGMIVYTGAMFPQWRGNLLIGALSGEALIRIGLNGDKARPLNQWAMGARIRDVAQAPDSAIWLLQDDGALMRVTPSAK
ncbi:MAG: PQQ-dependent sugar dehydrogenase [Sphingomonas sp.]